MSPSPTMSPVPTIGSAPTMGPAPTTSASLAYAGTSAAVVGIVSIVLWPFLDAPGRSGVLLAAAIAVSVQAGAFWALLRFRGTTNGFLAAWLGGTALRMVVVGVVAFLVVRSDMEGAVPMLLALATYLFGLLLLEPVFFRPGPSTAPDADGAEA